MVRRVVTAIMFACVLSAVLVAASVSAAGPRPADRLMLRAPASVWITRAAERSITIRWTPASGAVQYDVLRDGRLIARVRGTTFTDRSLRQAQWQQYQIIARRGQATSGRSEAVSAVTLAANRCTSHVTSWGDDHAAGDAQHPWRTIARAVREWEPGAVICLRGAFVEDVTIRRGGNNAAPVVLRSAPGVRALIRGRLWIARGADRVVVSDLRLDGRANTGVGRGDLPSPTINANNAVFLRNDVYNARTRICFVLGSIRGYGRAASTVLAYNRIHDCGRRRADGSGNNHHHGIYIENALRARIVSNVIYQNADRGIQLYPNAQSTLITGNVIDGNGEGVIFSGAEGYSSSSNRVVNNVIAHSRTRYNIEYWWEPGTRVGRNNAAVRNCLGGARQGNLALPQIGYTARANREARVAFRNRARGDFRLVSRSPCAAWMRSRVLPLLPM